MSTMTLIIQKMRCAVVLAIALATSCKATDDHSLFAQANQQYKNGLYDQALSTYKKIEKPWAAVHYNLGNCAYKLSKLGYALAYWRQAELTWGLDGRYELIKNIELVTQALAQKNSSGTKATEPNTFALTLKAAKRAFLSCIRIIPLFALQLLVLIAWVLLFMHIKRLFKRKNHLVIVSLFLFMGLSGAMLAIKYNTLSRSHAIIVLPQATLYSGPGTTYTQLGQLPEGQELVTIKESNGFYKVKYNGFIGWIPANTIICI